MRRGWDGRARPVQEKLSRPRGDGSSDFSVPNFIFLATMPPWCLGIGICCARGDIGGVFSLVWQRFPEAGALFTITPAWVEKAN